MFTLRMQAHALKQEIFSSDTRNLPTAVSHLLRTSSLGWENAGSSPLLSLPTLRYAQQPISSWISFGRKSKGKIALILTSISFLSFISFLHHMLLAGHLSFKLYTS